MLVYGFDCCLTLIIHQKGEKKIANLLLDKNLNIFTIMEILAVRPKIT